MSTRCQIGIYEDEKNGLDKPFAMLYRHCDGYPEDGAGDALKHYLPIFKTNRGNDPEYRAARILIALMREHEMLRENDFLSYGICGDKKLHGNIEYYYACYPDRLEIYEVIATNFEYFKLLETFEF